MNIHPQMFGYLVNKQTKQQNEKILAGGDSYTAITKDIQ